MAVYLDSPLFTRPAAKPSPTWHAELDAAELSLILATTGLSNWTALKFCDREREHGVFLFSGLLGATTGGVFVSTPISSL